MEVSDLVGNQYALHGIIAGFVLFLAVLVFAFGFKSAEEPPFDKLTSSHDERKSAGKKKKIKDKKSQSNGHATAVIDSTKQTKSVEKSSPSKDKTSPVKKSPVKNALKETKANSTREAELKDKKPKGKGKENIEIKTKKNKAVDEKPKDYDDGEWEQVLSSKDKKNRKTVPEEIMPLKNDKKKEKKKLKEFNDVEPVSEPAEIIEEEVIIKEIKVETKPVSQKVEAYSTVIEEIVQVDDKPKKSKKKKQAPEPPKPATELPQPSPKSVKKSKEENKTEPLDIPTETVSEPSAAAFDEMNDAWKEAKAPKKSNKKKSRKD